MGTLKFWLCGLILGDGYYDDRHVDIYNSSVSVIMYAIKALKEFGFPEEKININVYGNPSNEKLKTKWSAILRTKNVRVIKATTPWESNSEKLRIRIASKKLADFINNTYRNFNQLKKTQKLEILCGLFDAEASVDFKGYIEFKQKDSKKGRRIIKIVYNTVRKYGVDATKLQTKHDKKKKNLYFCIKNLKRYKTLIGFYDDHKLKNLELLIQILKLDRKVKEEFLLNVLNEQKKTIQEVMVELLIPYHRVRETLLKLYNQDKITIQKSGYKNYYCMKK